MVERTDSFRDLEEALRRCFFVSFTMVANPD